MGDFLCNFAIMILIVDDDKTVLMSLRLMLTRKGHEVVTATSREEAMTIVRARQPQLILMDMNYSLSKKCPQCTSKVFNFITVRNIVTYHCSFSDCQTQNNIIYS